MEYKSLWGISSGDIQDELKRTDNIYRIIEEQCKYLFEETQGKVFAVFGEIEKNGSLNALTKAILNIYKSISGISEVYENIGETSTKNLIDANDMYYDKHYGFEICTEKYRFRLFELRMTPIYPIEITIDEGICKNISNALIKIAIQGEQFNNFKIVDEETFYNVLQKVLQDRKVQYIIDELQKRVQDKSVELKDLPSKVIICEGQTDEVILQAIARKLNQKVMIVVATGKNNVPNIFDAVKAKNTKSNILIVLDADGNEEKTEELITEKINADNYELAIINDSIEDWFMPEVKDFSKLKLMQSIDTIIEKISFDEVSKVHKSFAKVVEFLKK